MNISVDIGAHEIKIAEGKKSGNKITIKNIIKVKTPVGCIIDGELKDVQLLAQTIKNAISANNIKGKAISISINSTVILTRELVVPKAKHSEIIKMVNSEMFQGRASADNYTIDYIVINEILEEKKKKLKILAAAVPQHIVEQYVKLCALLKYKKQYLDLTSNRIYKACLQQPSIMNSEKPSIIASVGARNAIFLIIENGRITFSKTISLDINKYLGLTSDNVTIDYSKVNLNISDSDEHLRLVEEFAYDVAQEISKIIQFQFARSTSRDIGEIYLIGAVAQALGVEKRVADILDKPVKEMEKPACIKSRINFKYSQYVSTIGGLIRLGDDK